MKEHGGWKRGEVFLRHMERVGWLVVDGETAKSHHPDLPAAIAAFNDFVAGRSGDVSEEGEEQ